MSIKSLEDRVGKLERQIGEGKPVVLRVVRYEGTDSPENYEVFSPEEEAVLQKYEEEKITAAKPGEHFITVYWTKQKAQELLIQARNDEKRDKLNN
jgi:hypothetical protein